MTCERREMAAPQHDTGQKTRWCQLSVSGPISRINRTMRSKRVFSGNKTQENKALGVSVVNTDTNHVSCDAHKQFDMLK